MKIKKNFLYLLIPASFLIGELSPALYSNIVIASPSPIQGPSPAANKKLNQQHKEELPRVIFLNQSAVLVASRKHRWKYKEHQARLIDMMNKGITVLVCPDCMKQYGVKAGDLIDGVQVGTPNQAQES